MDDDDEIVGIEKVKSFWNERWKMVETKAPTKQKDYFVSDYGRVKSVEKTSGVERLMKVPQTLQGVLLLNLKLKDNVTQGDYVHKLVAAYFVEPGEEDQIYVMHLDGNKQNNHYKNLAYMNQREMTDFWIAKGIYEPGNRKRGAHYKMTTTKVKLLKQRLKEGKTKKKILAKNFNITVEQLRKIEKGIDWGYVTLDDEK